MTPRPGPGELGHLVEREAQHLAARRRDHDRPARRSARPTTISSPSPTRASAAAGARRLGQIGRGAEAVARAPSRPGSPAARPSPRAEMPGSAGWRRRPRRLVALAHQPRRDDALAVAELEQRLHRLAVAGRRRHVGDAQHVDACPGSRRARADRASCPGSTRGERVALAQPRRASGPSPRARASSSRRARGRRSRPRARCRPRGRTRAPRRRRSVGAALVAVLLADARPAPRG